jgi:hypothetical protein
VVATTQEHQIRQRRRPTLGPVLDVMGLREAKTAAGEATAAIPLLQDSA